MGHQCCPSRCRMHSVLGPMLRRGVLDRLAKHALEGNEESVVGIRHHPSCCPVPIKLGKPFVIHRATAKHERLAYHQPDLGQCSFSAIEQRIVIFFIYFHRSVVLPVELVPNIVHADENA